MTPYVDILGVGECEALAQRITQGDRAAEAELVRSYCDCVFAMALTRTHDREAARELMDDVLMAVIGRGAVDLIDDAAEEAKDQGHEHGQVEGLLFHKTSGCHQ